MTAVEEEVLGQHALEAGFLRELRDAATRDAAYDLGGLGHLDGLRLAGDKGWARARAALDDGQAGEVFAASVLALEHRDLRRLALIIDVAGDSPALARGLVSALGWVSFDHVRAILPGLLDTRCPAAQIRRAFDHGLPAGDQRLAFADKSRSIVTAASSTKTGRYRALIVRSPRRRSRLLLDLGEEDVGAAPLAEGRREALVDDAFTWLFLEPEERGGAVELAGIEHVAVDADDRAVVEIPRQIEIFNLAQVEVESIPRPDRVDDEVVLAVDALLVVVEGEREIFNLDIWTEPLDRLLRGAREDEVAVGAAEERGELDPGLLLAQRLAGIRRPASSFVSGGSAPSRCRK